MNYSLRYFSETILTIWGLTAVVYLACTVIKYSSTKLVLKVYQASVGSTKSLYLSDPWGKKGMLKIANQKCHLFALDIN